MEELNPSEISQIIKEKIDALDASAKPSNEGTVVFLADGIARIHGLGSYERRADRVRSWCNGHGP